MSDIDKEIAEFHRAGRKRKAWIFGISGVLVLALGIGLLVVCFTLSGEDDMGQGRYPVKIIVRSTRDTALTTSLSVMR